jgi:lipoprotein-releasing system ATP-binding protein
MIRKSRDSGRKAESRRELPDFVIQAEKLTKNFDEAGRKLEVLKGINLFIRAGEIIALVGPSGAGKSTLLHLLGLMEKPSGGELTLL